MKASIIIPNYNGEMLLAKNLPCAISAMNNKENNIFEIIVVDDGSADGSVKLIKDMFPRVKLIKHTKNRGFSAAINTGARAAKGNLLVLLNSDVIPSPDFLKAIANNFNNPKVFAVSMHEKGYGWAKGTFIDGYVGLAMGEESIVPAQSFYVSGGSGVFRRSLWMELGGMDEKLLSPFYWEDIDLCYRATKRGYQILWEPESNVVHKHESTISKLSKRYVGRIKERNQLLFIWKNITSANLTRKHFAGLLKRLIRHPGYTRIIIMALGRLSVVLKARKKEIKESKVSDEAIFSRFS
ncbi:MAG: glycosyltransferase family 2 protein [Patescibacteria group bacterium]